MDKLMKDAIEVALEAAWAEFQESDPQPGTHVGTLEAMEILREATGKRAQRRQPSQQTPEQEEQGRFFDWLLHTRKDKALAYEFLLRTGTLTVGPREYWTTQQGGQRAIAWESSFTYPGSDSEIWDVILVDD